ncbi:MAG: hypothetical protein RIQ79_599 [Verrucomicrobiota bacterium]|jgi:phosphate transport system substrate-binding protein
MIRPISVLFLSIIASGLALAEPLKIVGSDLLNGTVDVELTKFAKTNDHEIAVEFKGSRLALETLQSKQADMGLMVFGADDTKPGPEFTTLVVGYFTTFIAVPKSMVMSQISFERMGAIFGARESSDARRWADIGVVGALSQRNILAVASGRRAGLSLDIFRYGVLSKPELKSTVLLFDTAEEAEGRISSDEGGIVLLPTAPTTNGKLKVLLLSKTVRDVAYGPTPENLHSGDYPLRLPVQLVFRKGDAKRLGYLIRHLLADETMATLNAANVISLPTQARKQVIFDLETM